MGLPFMETRHFHCPYCGQVGMSVALKDKDGQTAHETHEGNFRIEGTAAARSSSAATANAHSRATQNRRPHEVVNALSSTVNAAAVTVLCSSHATDRYCRAAVWRQPWTTVTVRGPEGENHEELARRRRFDRSGAGR
jgi:hypothetical protein